MSKRVVISCVQMQNELEVHRERLEAAGIELVVPQIVGQQLSEAELVELMPGIVGIIAGDDIFSRPALEASKDLKILSKWGIGTDSIDKVAAAELGIPVTNTPGVFGDEVADMALGYVLMLARSQHVIDAAVRRGEWPKVEGQTLRGQQAIVVGLGSIGLSTATRLQAVGLEVSGSDPSEAAQQAASAAGITPVDLDAAIGEADWIVLTAPLVPATHHLIDAERIKAMKPGVRIVNVARGPLIDEPALIDGLQSGHVAGAGLDVFEVEPLPMDSPLRSLPGLVLGAHNGSNTRQAVARTSAVAVDNLLAHLQD